MKIGNWNIERLKYPKNAQKIQSEIDKRNFDILVLTEYDERIKPSGFKYEIHTDDLISDNTDNYLQTERRVKIFSKYPIIRELKTFDKKTACCAEFKTDLGNLIVYGTIIGIYGNRNQNFKDNLLKQILDFKQINVQNNICVVGDYNITFFDNYYFTKFGREELNKVFKEENIEIITVEIENNIDHIAISKDFVNKRKAVIETWNLNRELSDHFGVSVEIS